MKPINFQELLLFEDDDYIVINKPSFVSTLDDRSAVGVSILAFARDYTKNPQVCHRLDKETSGALAIAKHPDAYRALSIQFEDRKVEKIYHAVCDGIHNFRDLVIDSPILTLSKGTVKIDRRGKPSETRVNTLKAYKRHTLVECRPLTGRMHQVRIHLSSIEAPIAGDDQYGGKPFYLSQIKKRYNLKRDTDEIPLIRRVALHARALGFRLASGEKITVEAPYPKDMAVVLKQLEKHS